MVNNSLIHENNNVLFSPNRCPKYIIIHYTGCRGSARNVARSMVRNKVSTHYICDKVETIHAVNECEFVAWHCATTRRKTYCGATNWNSIGVDLCTEKDDWESRSASDADWWFDDATIKNAVEVVAELMQRYGIPSERVVRHYDVTRKECPRPFVGDDLNSHTGKTGEDAWREFQRMIEEAACEKMDM